MSTRYELTSLSISELHMLLGLLHSNHIDRSSEIFRKINSAFEFCRASDRKIVKHVLGNLPNGDLDLPESRLAEYQKERLRQADMLGVDKATVGVLELKLFCSAISLCHHLASTNPHHPQYHWARQLAEYPFPLNSD